MISLPTQEIEQLLFNGRINQTKLRSYLPEVSDDWSFIELGEFNEVNWLNTPGPFYTTTTDSTGTGQPAAMNNVGGDEDYREIIFKQPFTKQELEETLDAAACDPFSAYYFDGNQHWTEQLVVQWWKESHDRISYIIDMYEKELAAADKISERYLYGPGQGIAQNYKNWLDFYEKGMKEYLEWYILKIASRQVILEELHFDWTRKHILDSILHEKQKS